MPQVALGSDVVLNQQPFDFFQIAERQRCSEGQSRLRSWLRFEVWAIRRQYANGCPHGQFSDLDTYPVTSCIFTKVAQTE